MRRLLGTMLLLGLAGCASGDSFHQQQQMPVPPISAVTPRIDPNKLSPAARAAAPKTDATESQQGDGLLDCVTESCKINCSPKVKKQFQPKWCVNFKEPVE